MKYLNINLTKCIYIRVCVCVCVCVCILENCKNSDERNQRGSK